jgi:hypothetical protein
MKDHDAFLAESMILSEETKLTFLREDIALCHTYVTISKMKFQLGHWESADHSRSRAEACYALASRSVGTLRVRSHQQQDIEQRLGHLRAALNELSQLIGPMGGGNKDSTDEGVV